jgi:hypothetical protein
MTAPITAAVDGLTDRVIAYRVIRRMGMTLEIKGLKANMLKVGKRIESINALAAGFDEQGAALEQGLKDITAQVAGHAEDLNFAATVLGNSTVPSEGSPAVEPPPATFPEQH